VNKVAIALKAMTLIVLMVGAAQLAIVAMMILSLVNSMLRLDCVSALVSVMWIVDCSGDFDYDERGSEGT